MASGREEFKEQLIALGIVPQEQDADRVVIDYQISAGRFAGQMIKMGFVVPAEFSRTPPGGPHICPRLLPMNPSAPEHPNRTAESPFGPDWQYLSRPFPAGEWKGRKGVAEYLAYIDRLFATT